MTDVAGLLASAAIAAVLAPGALRALEEAGWTRENYRGRAVPFPAGVVAAVAGFLALAVVAIVSPRGYAVAFVPLFAAVAFLGLLDDLFEGAPRGWRGHFGAALRGGFSTGVLKAAGTVALAAFALRAARPDAGAATIVLGVAVIALATNLFNLLDLRPGRAWKAYVATFAGLVAAGGTAPLGAIGPFAGALLVLGAFDLRERAMLGDTGSNLLGALAGVQLVLVLGTGGQVVALGVLAALTIFGEFGSFTRTIDRLPPLRALDSLGRRDA